jgi:hypothetical protein
LNPLNDGDAIQADPQYCLEGAIRLLYPLSQAVRIGRPTKLVTAAIARELAGFIWAIARRVLPVASM